MATNRARDRRAGADAYATYRASLSGGPSGPGELSALIPISVVKFGDEAERLILEVLRSGQVAQGAKVAEFEESFASFCDVRHAIAVNSGTTALVAVLQALDLGPTDDVLTSPFTFAATLNAIIEAGATARFADIRSDDFSLDPLAVKESIGDRTRALLPVHLYGQAADMGQIVALASENRLALVEDCAQAHGATFSGQAVGSFGIGCFSFYATKNLTTGEGGMITTNDDVLADRLRLLRNQGMRHPYKYEMAGHNYRMTELAAALGLSQLPTYAATLVARRQNAARLSAGLADVPGLQLPVELPNRGHVWHQYTVLLTDDSPVDRDEFVAALARRGIGCGVYYPRTVFNHPCYLNHPRVVIAPVPVAESVARRCVSLPVHNYLSTSDVDRVVDAVRRTMKA